MEWVLMNRIAVESPAAADQIVEAFRHRTGKVDSQPGFLRFELWREDAGREVVVITRWRTKADFEAWVESPAFREAHRHAEGAPGRGGGSVYEVLL